MKHITSMTRERPMMAQDGGGFWKAILNGLFFGINPLFILYITGKFNNNNEN